MRVFTVEKGKLEGVSVKVKRDVHPSIPGEHQLVQFFPLDGPGVVNFTREEMNAVGKFLGLP